MGLTRVKVLYPKAGFARDWIARGFQEVAQSFDLLKLCGSSSEKAADFEEHEVCATLLSSLFPSGPDVEAGCRRDAAPSWK